MAITFTGLGQQMPYNPDANGDAFIGVDDVLGVLGVYDTALIQPDLTCDYEGTDLEQLFIGLADNTLLLDSVYVEYLLYDTLEYFTPGCPDIVLEPVVLERSYMMYQAGPNIYAQSEFFGFARTFQLSYNETANSFQMYVYDQEVQENTGYYPYGYLADVADDQGICGSANHTLPFPDSVSLTEDGIQGPFCNWPQVAEYFKVIPFWHEAE